MKTVKVVAAVIRKDNMVYATERGYGEFKDMWEFPGGKIEEGENAIDALKREIKEELDTTIEVEEYIDTIEYDYPTFHLSMECYWCRVKEGKLTLLEHENAKWLDSASLYSVKWLKADLTIIEKVKEGLKDPSRLLK